MFLSAPSFSSCSKRPMIRDDDTHQKSAKASSSTPPIKSIVFRLSVIVNTIEQAFQSHNENIQSQPETVHSQFARLNLATIRLSYQA